MTLKEASFELAYPAGQQWGAMFITVGKKPTSDISKRAVLDFSGYDELLVELKGAMPGESVAVGVKTNTDPDNAAHRYSIIQIPDIWTTYHIPLTKLGIPPLTTEQLKKIYVVTEFVFTDAVAHTIDVRDIHFAAATSTLPKVSKPSGAIYYGNNLENGFDMGVDTSEHKTDWVIDRKGYMECRYPEGQAWGAIFITVDKAKNIAAQRKTTDMSKYNFLCVDLKGENGGEKVSIGIKTK